MFNNRKSWLLLLGVSMFLVLGFALLTYDDSEIAATKLKSVKESDDKTEKSEIIPKKVKTEPKKNQPNPTATNQASRDSSDILACENSPNSSGPDNDLDLLTLSQKFETIDKNTSDFLVAYKLLSLEDDKAFKLFKKLSDAPGFQEVADYNLLKLCSRSSHPDCSDTLVENIVDKTPQNALTWLMAASYYAENKNYEAMKNAFKHALSAPEYRSGFAQEVLLVSNAIRTTENMSESDIGMNLLGLHAAESIPGHKHINYCVEQAKNSSELAQICMGVAELMINQGSTDWSVLLGYNFATKLNESLGETDEAERLKQVKKSYSGYWDSEPFREAFSLAMNDTSLWGYLLEAMLNYSEKEARDRFVEEAKRRSRDPSYNPCKGSAI